MIATGYWAERFKSVLLEGGEALAAVAAYIELNPVRAGLCADPKDYRYCGFGRLKQKLGYRRHKAATPLSALGSADLWVFRDARARPAA